MRTLIWLTLLPTAALAGGGGPETSVVYEPVQRMYTCWECSVSFAKVFPTGPGYVGGTVSYTSYGLSGEACEAELAAEVLDAYGGYTPETWLDWGFQLVEDMDLFEAFTPSHAWVELHMSNAYIGDLDGMPASLTCDNSPWQPSATSSGSGFQH